MSYLLKGMEALNLDPTILSTIKDIHPLIAPVWEEIDEITLLNQAKVLHSFQKLKVGEEDFQDSSGYGYNDMGREKLEHIFAQVFGGEKALVRPHFVSGTHTIVTTLLGLLRPGERLISLTGAPYDTLQQIIGHHANNKNNEDVGTLKDWGIQYDELTLNQNGYPELTRLKDKLFPETKVALIQRSQGYESSRVTLTVEDIAHLVQALREQNPRITIVVDNCYGEFVESTEPLEAGADIIAGSLIKNAGGGLAPTGGYVVGKEHLIKKISACLSAPYLEDHLGAVWGKRFYYMGLFNAPELVSNSLKAAVFASALFARLGYQVNPLYNEKRGDIVQAIRLNDPELVKIFCHTIQEQSPVDSYLKPEPAQVPGYAIPVIMAAGTFIQGASGELSADAPMREPYTVFIQGAFTLNHALMGICRAAENIIKNNHLKGLYKRELP